MRGGRAQGVSRAARAATSDHERRVVVLCALRADFYGRLGAYPRVCRAAQPQPCARGSDGQGRVPGGDRTAGRSCRAGGRTPTRRRAPRRGARRARRAAAAVNDAARAVAGEQRPRAPPRGLSREGGVSGAVARIAETAFMRCRSPSGASPAGCCSDSPRRGGIARAPLGAAGRDRADQRRAAGAHSADRRAPADRRRRGGRALPRSAPARVAAVSGLARRGSGRAAAARPPAAAAGEWERARARSGDLYRGHGSPPRSTGALSTARTSTDSNASFSPPASSTPTARPVVNALRTAACGRC